MHLRAVDSYSVKQEFWIVPAIFCTRHYVNHGWYLPSDETLEVEHMKCRRNKDVEFYQTQSLDGASDFQFDRVFGNQALHNNYVNDEFNSNYSSSYSLNF